MSLSKEEYEGIVNTEPLKEEHICWYTSNRSNSLGKFEIALMEVVKCTYPHPCAPEYGYLITEETRFIKRVDRMSEEAGVLVCMEANQNAITYMQNLLKDKD